MPKSPRRKTAKKQPSFNRPEPEALDFEDSPRPRSKVQTIGALLIVLLIAFSLLIGAVLPFMAAR